MNVLNRCLVTNNPCGTDTWQVGYYCSCEPCQHYLRAQESKRRLGSVMRDVTHAEREAAAKRIAFALDVPKWGEAFTLIDELESYVGAFKVGLELFTAVGPEIIKQTSKPVILDLKLHDIPETVARTVKAGGDHGVKFMTLHVQQRKALEAAVVAAEEFGITLLCVTVLTSMNDDDCKDLGHVPLQPSTRALTMAQFAHTCGLRGFVCSPHEVGRLKTALPNSFFLVPGVRPAGSDVGDQKRTGTPSQAVKDGADLIVIGRPIRDADHRISAAMAIAEEIARG
jgi:orotidine-5'-phosphate decarboxylase